MHNFLTICLELERYDEFREGLARIEMLARQIKGRSRGHKQFHIRLMIFGLKLDFYSRRREFEECRTEIHFFDEYLREQPYDIEDMYKILFFFNCAANLLYGGYAHEALQWLWRILNDSTLHGREDVVLHTHLINLITIYELGNRDVIENQIRHTP